MNKSICEARYREVLSRPIPGLGATKANLSRLLRSLDLVGWSTHEESGRIDRRALTRVSMGAANVFSRRQFKEAETSAVSVLVDMSSSMSSVDEEVEAVTIHLSKILSQTRASFSITGFRSSSHQSCSAKDRITGQEEERLIEAPLFIPFKQWNEPYVKCIAKIGSFKKHIRGGTPDFSAISNALDDLSRQESNRKILFLLTDADGYITSHMKELQRLADRLGIMLIAIGIGTTAVTKCFTNSVAIFNANDIASVSFNQLIRTLERKANR